MMNLNKRLEKLDEEFFQSLPSLYKLNNDDEIVPVEQEVLFEVNSQIKQLLSDVIDEIVPERDVRNSFTSGWTGTQSGECCDRCALKEKDFNGRADALKAIVGCKNPFQVDTSCQCHIPHRKGFVVGKNNTIDQIKANAKKVLDESKK